MQYFTITTALIALTGLANLIQGSTVPTAADMNLTTAALNGTATPGMNVTGPMKWTGPSKGVNITLYGTASEIITQLKALDPEWAPHIPDDGVKNVTAVPVNRGDPDRDFVVCSSPSEFLKFMLLISTSSGVRSSAVQSMTSKSSIGGVFSLQQVTFNTLPVAFLSRPTLVFSQSVLLALASMSATM